MEKILKFPIVPQRVYEQYTSIRNFPVYDTNSMIKLLKTLTTDAQRKDNSEISKIAKTILFDFKNYLNHPAIYKEKYTASALELRFSILGQGRTSDNLRKQNALITSLLDKSDIEKIPTNIHLKICSNFREKGDLVDFPFFQTN